MEVQMHCHTKDLTIELPPSSKYRSQCMSTSLFVPQRSPYNSPTNLFMSHSWDSDAKGRPTHERVKLLKQELNKLGWKVWFDEEQLLVGCNIDVNMANGIKHSDAVCVCLTKTYIEKVNSQNNNCSKEFNN